MGSEVAPEWTPIRWHVSGVPNYRHLVGTVDNDIVGEVWVKPDGTPTWEPPVDPRFQKAVHAAFPDPNLYLAVTRWALDDTFKAQEWLRAEIIKSPGDEEREREARAQIQSYEAQAAELSWALARWTDEAGVQAREQESIRRRKAYTLTEHQQDVLVTIRETTFGYVAKNLDVENRYADLYQAALLARTQGDAAGKVTGHAGYELQELTNQMLEYQKALQQSLITQILAEERSPEQDEPADDRGVHADMKYINENFEPLTNYWEPPYDDLTVEMTDEIWWEIERELRANLATVERLLNRYRAKMKQATVKLTASVVMERLAEAHKLAELQELSYRVTLVHLYTTTLRNREIERYRRSDQRSLRRMDHENKAAAYLLRGRYIAKELITCM